MISKFLKNKRCLATPTTGALDWVVTPSTSGFFWTAIVADPRLFQVTDVRPVLRSSSCVPGGFGDLLPTFERQSVTGLFGAGCRIRTDDLSLTRRLHYHCANPAYYYCTLFTKEMQFIWLPDVGSNHGPTV